ncbi:M4 family metallopeptidase [Dactylosporangium sp. NPDC051541]|uniref:M4 family metallopeptidase n=1 Tax=Dactylosporangium sp. NPDC051541 TaxID=3363977 RepID=UPI0037A39A50
MSTVRRALIAVAVSAVALAGCENAPKAVNNAANTSPGPSQTGAGAETDPLDADTSPSPEAEPAAAAPVRKLLDSHLADVQAAPEDSFGYFALRPDANGDKHVRYTRTYHGLPVYGGDVIVHVGANGQYRGSSNGLVSPLKLGTVPKVSAADAAAKARTQFTGAVSQLRGQRLLVEASTGTGRLAWENVVVGTARDGKTPSRLHVLTDAVSGDVIGRWDEIEPVAGTGHSLYSGPVTVETQRFGSQFRLVDQTRGRASVCDLQHTDSGSCAQLSDADNTWGTGKADDPQTAAVDAAYGAQLTYDYYLKSFGRKGIANNGRGVVSRVHVGDQLEGAFWDGKQMNYGDGRGNAHPVVELDVAAHEMTHGVTQNSVPDDLTYAGESGGLNEATSDIFGTMVEFYAANTNDSGDYLIAEKIDINGNGTPLRYMYNPALDGVSHSCWSASTKDVDVHYSSGVANHFFFDLAEGTGKTAFGTSPVCGGAGAVTGIGRDKAAAIWYRALDVYFTSSTSYVNAANPGNTARAYTLSAAADLYGSCGAEYKAVQRAWTAVNVAGADAAC